MISVDMDMLTAAIAGDPAAVSALLTVLRPRLCGYLSSRVPRGADVGVEDVVQEVLLAVARLLPRFEGPVDKFEATVYATADHKAVDAWRYSGRLRRSARHVPLEDIHPEKALEVATYLSPERLFDDRQALGELNEGFRRLSPQQRAVVWLRAEGRSSAEVGAMLGISATLVRVRHHRAMAVLRDWGTASAMPKQGGGS